MLPSDLNGPPPAPGTPNYFAQFDDDAWGYSPDQLQIWAFHVDWNTPANSSFTEQAGLLTAPVDSNLCNYGACVPQPSTTSRLTPLSDRLMYRLQYRNFGAYATLVTNHTVDVDGTDHAAVRWYELRNSGSGWSIYQQGTFAPDADHRFMGSIAMDAAGNIALGYSVSGISTFPSIRYTGRLAGDPLGTFTQGETTLTQGSGSQTIASGRWGDYSMMAVDPSDDCTFWYTQEYYAVTSSSVWQTRVSAFRFPSCGTAPGGADMSLAQVASPNPAFKGGDVTLTLTVVNNGPDPATSVAISDPLPSGATLKTATASQGSCSTARTVVCALGSLAPSSSATVTIVVTATATGSISNTATVAASESDPYPANNSAATTITVLAPRPDLVETALGKPPAAVLPGQKFSVTDTVRNQGLASSGSSTVQYYLSADQAKSTGDTLLGGRSVLALAVGATSTGTITVTVPAATPLGSYYLLACADNTNVVVESNESNNCLASVTALQVTRPDLVVTTVSNPPAAAKPGGSFAVTDTVKNQGLLSAASSRAYYYLSLDSIKSTGDTLLTGYRSVSSLAAGASSSATVTVKIPTTTPLGTYYLLACADGANAVIEADESNNCRASATPISIAP